MDKKMITIGKIASPYGVKGFVKVYPYSDFMDRCFSLKTVHLKKSANSPGPGRLSEVEQARIHKNLWTIKFKGVNTREEAETLRGYLILIRPEERVSLPEGHYYFDEIIGLQVFTMDGTLVGRVRDILQTGSNDVYVVEPADTSPESKKEILIPAIKEVVKEINIDKEHILINPLEELI